MTDEHGWTVTGLTSVAFIYFGSNRQWSYGTGAGVLAKMVAIERQNIPIGATRGEKVHNSCKWSPGYGQSTAWDRER